MILINGTFRMPIEARAKARPLMERMIVASRAEEGCIAYHYAPDLVDETIVHVVERWKDRAALERHFKSEHLNEWRAAFPDLGISDRDLKLFDVDDGEPV